MTSPLRDFVDSCNTCPFLYVSPPYGQNCNRCLHPVHGQEGKKLKRPMFNVDTLKRSFPPSERWDVGRVESPIETVEGGYTPEWCPLKTQSVIVEWNPEACAAQGDDE